VELLDPLRLLDERLVHQELLEMFGNPRRGVDPEPAWSVAARQQSGADGGLAEGEIQFVEHARPHELANLAPQTAIGRPAALLQSKPHSIEAGAAAGVLHAGLQVVVEKSDLHIKVAGLPEGPAQTANATVPSGKLGFIEGAVEECKGSAQAAAGNPRLMDRLLGIVTAQAGKVSAEFVDADENAFGEKLERCGIRSGHRTPFLSRGRYRGRGVPPANQTAPVDEWWQDLQK